MIDISLSYLVVGLHQHDSIAEVSEAGLDRPLNTRELPSIARHTLLRQ